MNLFLFCYLHSFYFLDSRCKWKHTVFGFVCLTYFTKQNTIQFILQLLYSLVDGHLGYFHPLAVVNNATMNIGMHIYFSVSHFVSYWYIPRSVIAGSYGSCIFNFLRNVVFFCLFFFWGMLFFIVAVQIYIPTNSELGFTFLHILISTGCLFSFL